MIRQVLVPTVDGRVLRAYDTGGPGPVVLWCHGTPNVGRPPEPLFGVGGRLGVRWIGYDRPGYGPSTPRPGRSVADTADDVRAVALALGVARLSVLSHSGGGPGALAAAALLPDLVTAVAAFASPAPRDGDDERWLDGLAPGSRRELAAAIEGRGPLTRVLESEPWDETAFTGADHAALAGAWSWFDGIVEEGTAQGLDPMVDDDLALVAPWGVDLGRIRVPALLVAGDADRMVPPSHSARSAALIPGAELWTAPGAGHISVLEKAPDALDWLIARS